MEGTQNTDRRHDFLQSEAYGWRKVRLLGDSWRA